MHLVSILVFLELALEELGQSFQMGMQQVSILVFLELALEGGHSGVIASGRAMFQSLFSWNLPSKLQTGNPRHLAWHVSILVFLELALEVYRVIELF